MSDQQQALRVVGITLTDIGIFDHYEIRPGQITVIEGDNEVGKTTIEQSILAVFDGGNKSQVRLIRNGKETGKIAIELSNGSIFEKILNRNGKGELKAKHPEFGNMKAAQTLLGRISDGVAVDPTKLLNGEPDERVRYFQSKLPIPLPVEQLKEIVPAGMPYSTEGHTLSVLGTLRKQLEEARKAKGIIKREKQATIETLRKTIPPGEPVDIAAEIHDKRVELSSSERKLADVETTIRSQQEQTLKKVLAGIDEEIATGDKELNKEIERLRSEWKMKRDHLQEGKVQNTKQSQARASSLLDEAHGELKPPIEKLQTDIASLESKRDDQVRINAQRDLLNRTIEEEENVTASWQDYDNRVKKLDALRESLTADLPIAGLSIEDGDLVFEGMPWEQLNMAKRVMLVFRIAEHCAGELGFTIFDGLECLSANTLELFRQEALASGRQILVTRVTSGPLKITALEGTPSVTTP